MRLQRLQIGFFFFCLLAAPLLAAAGPDVPFIRPGALEIAFDPRETSFLPVDTEALRQGLCTGFHGLDGQRPPITPAGECEMIVHSPPRLGLFTRGTPVRGSAHVIIYPTSLPAWEGDTEIVTSCGVWSVSMALDPNETQPASELALEPSTEDSSQGVFAGVVQLAVLFHVADRTGGISLDLPAVIPLDLAGRWAAVPEDDPSLSGVADDASNLVLFAGLFDGTWSIVPGQATWGSRPCSVHPLPPSSLLDDLNQNIH
jgi:hypothetical protein